MASVLQIDLAELQPLVNAAVDAAVRRSQAAAQPTDGTGKILLTKREAAAALSVSVSTLDRLTHPRGDLRAVRLDGRVLFRFETLQEWTKNKEKEEI